MTHKLLVRQVRRHFGSSDDVPDVLRPFMASVAAAYRQADDDRALLEHSLETVSEELIDRFRLLTSSLAESQSAAARLSQAISALTATLESTTDGILVVDTDGRMVQMNQKFVELWRIPKDILAAQNDDRALEFVHQQLRDPAEFLAKVRELYDDPDAESFDVLHFRDGRVCERFSRPQRVDGVTVGRVWSFRDVTARRQLEAQLRQAQKMEAVGQLAGGIAHDFNNLLTVITNYSTLLLDEPSVRGTVSDDIAEIKAAADRAAGLTRQLLAFSRQQLLQPRVLDLNAVSLALAPMLRRMIGEDIRITTSTDAHLGPVLADPGQIEQVIMNLVVNARDAMPSGGTITVETSNVDLGGWRTTNFRTYIPPGRYSMLAVSDTGCGMDAATQARIFEPFFTTKEPGHGTGLGLATVYGIVKQSGGFIWVYSEMGLGTTFKIYLPHAAADAIEADAPDTHLTIPRGSETILLVEDEDAVRRLTARVLTRQGYDVVEARTGTEALGVVGNRGASIDLIITDIVMPQVNGSQLAASVRLTFPALRIIYMSGYTDNDIVRRGLLDPDMVFIQKPFTARALAIKVREVLDAA